MAKGGSYEREVCKTLSLWWSDNKDDDLFWRTSGSGARATVRGRKGKTTRNHCGDICNTDSVGEPLIKVITFELKRGYSRNNISELLDCPLDSSIQTYEEWFEKAETSRFNAGSFSWMLIHKRDRRDPVCFIPLYFYNALREVGALSLLEHPFLWFNVNLRRSNGERVEEEIFGFRFDDFLTGVKKDDILKFSNQGKIEGP